MWDKVTGDLFLEGSCSLATITGCGLVARHHNFITRMKVFLGVAILFSDAIGLLSLAATAASYRPKCIVGFGNNYSVT